jgi:hypothetical protein
MGWVGRGASAPGRPQAACQLQSIVRPLGFVASQDESIVGYAPSVTDNIVAALIAAAASLVGTLALLVIERRKLASVRAAREADREAFEAKLVTYEVERAAHEAKREAELETVTAATATRLTYPYVCDLFRVTDVIKDFEGTVRVIEHTEGFRTSSGTTLHVFRGDRATTGRIIGPGPRLTYASRADMTLSGYFAEPHLYRYELRFEAGLSPDDDPCAFTIEWDEAEAVYVAATTINELYANYGLPYEFSSQLIQTPHAALEIVVVWPPPGGEFNAFPNVTFGTLDTPATAERRRVSDGFTITPSSAILRVQDPKIGMRYLIGWQGASKFVSTKA